MPDPIIGSQAGTISRGQRTSAASTARAVRDVRRDILNVSADATPLLSMFEGMLKKPRIVTNVAYEHLIDDELPRIVTLNGNSASGQATITLESGEAARVTIGHILKSHRTGVTMRVTAVNTGGNTITATRPFGGTSDDNLLDHDELAIIGFADTEGNTAPTALSGEPTAYTNYTQTFRRSIALTRREELIKKYGGDEWEREKARCISGLRLDIESAFLFSKAIQSTDPTATGGLVYWLSTNVFSVGGLLDEDTFQGNLEQVLRYNQDGGDLVLLAGANFMKALSRWQRDVLRTGVSDRVFGVKATRYQSVFGRDLVVVAHPLLSLRGSTVSTGLAPAGQAFLLNMDFLNKAELSGSEGIQYQEDIETPGTDGKAWACLADCGLDVRKQQAHGWWYGITG